MPLKPVPDDASGVMPEQIEAIAFDVSGAAAASGFGRNVLYDAMNSGALPARKYGRRTVIMRDDLVSWLRALPLRDAQAA